MPVARLEGPQDPVFRAVAELSGGLARARTGLFQVEGEHLTRQALAAGLLAQALVLDESLADEVAAAGVPTWLLPPKLLPRLLGTSYETSLGVVGVARRAPLAQPPAHGLVLAAETIQDPRNVGVLVRTAEAAGLAGLLLSDDSADPWARPAVRSSTGSILRCPLLPCADLADTLGQMRRAGWRVIATSARAAQPLWDCDLNGDVVLVVGNETAGLSAAVRAQADALVSLPVAGGASSLNVTVAAGIVVYEALRNRQGLGAVSALE